MTALVSSFVSGFGNQELYSQACFTVLSSLDKVRGQCNRLPSPEDGSGVGLKNVDSFLFFSYGVR